jgi:hypothetical protein
MGRGVPPRAGLASPFGGRPAFAEAATRRQAEVAPTPPHRDLFPPHQIYMIGRWLFITRNLLGTWSVSHGQESSDWDFTVIDRRA